ncbi:MAG: hypothetical protein IPP39_11110 [Chitinophagaceae bacterium]|nr:hypothetical protein [Chitinophagaceae bacterium]
MSTKPYANTATEMSTVQEPIIEYVAGSYTAVNLAAIGEMYGNTLKSPAEEWRQFDKSLTGIRREGKEGITFL